MTQTDNDRAQALLDEYKKKTYAELLAMPERIQLEISGLSEASTVEFSRELDEDQVLTINLKLYHWQSQEQKATQEQQQFLQDIPAEDVDEDDEEGEETFEEMITSMIASGELEEAIAPLPHKLRNDFIFSGMSYHYYFYIESDGTVIEDEYTQNQKAEDALIEEADWFGKTGLNEASERHLPRYLRMEYGEFVLDEDSLKARDLIYLGHIKLTEEDYNDEEGFSEEVKSVHMWQIPTSNNEPAYAFITIEDDGAGTMGMSGYCPNLKNRLH